MAQYQIKELVESNYDFAAVTIPNQDKIKAQTGKPLDLPYTVATVKRISENFTLSHDQALEADRMIAELVVRHNERNRPKLEAEAAEAEERRQLEEAIEALEIAMEFETDEAELASYREAVDALRITLEFM